MKQAQKLLGIDSHVKGELDAIRSRVVDGTCRWITNRPSYIDWIEKPEKLGDIRLFWLIGLPTTGKTTLASVIIDNLQSAGENCHYHFFSSSHQAKRTVAYCLRSIAYQQANQVTVNN